MITDVLGTLQSGVLELSEAHQDAHVLNDARVLQHADMQQLHSMLRPEYYSMLSPWLVLMQRRDQLERVELLSRFVKSIMAYQKYLDAQGVRMP